MPLTLVRWEARNTGEHRTTQDKGRESEGKDEQRPLPGGEKRESPAGRPLRLHLSDNGPLVIFFPAKAEVKTEGEKVSQERRAGSESVVRGPRNHLRAVAHSAAHEGRGGPATPRAVPVPDSPLRLFLILTLQ